MSTSRPFVELAGEGQGVLATPLVVRARCPQTFRWRLMLVEEQTVNNSTVFEFMSQSAVISICLLHTDMDAHVVHTSAICFSICPFVYLVQVFFF